MYCTSCGHSNVEGASFCNVCGKNLPGEVIEQRPAPELSKGAVEAPLAVSAAQQSARSKLIGVGGWLLLFILGILLVSPLVFFMEAESSKFEPITTSLDFALAAVAI